MSRPARPRRLRRWQRGAAGKPGPQQPHVAAVLAPFLAAPIEHIGSTSVPGLPAKPVIEAAATIVALAQSLAWSEWAKSGHQIASALVTEHKATLCEIADIMHVDYAEAALLLTYRARANWASRSARPRATDRTSAIASASRLADGPDSGTWQAAIPAMSARVSPSRAASLMPAS
jgi:GrpB protein